MKAWCVAGLSGACEDRLAHKAVPDVTETPKAEDLESVEIPSEAVVPTMRKHVACDAPSEHGGKRRKKG